MTDEQAPDPINPAHYKQNSSGVEVIEVIEHMHCPCLANVFKYIARHRHKGVPEQDLGKALWYARRERELRGHPLYDPPVRRNLPPGAEERVYDFIEAESDPLSAKALLLVWLADREARAVPQLSSYALRDLVCELLPELGAEVADPVVATCGAQWDDYTEEGPRIGLPYCGMGKHTPVTDGESSGTRRGHCSKCGTHVWRSLP